VVGSSGAPRTATFASVMSGAGLNSLNLDYGSTLNQTLASSAMIAVTESIGSTQAQTSTYNQSAGSNTTTRLFIGEVGVGVYNLSGGALNIGTSAVAGDVDVGWQTSSVGAFNQSGGATTVVGQFRAGYNPSLSGGAAAVGTVTLKGGSFSVRGQVTIGVFGTGSFTQSGGSATLGGLILGYQPDSRGMGSYILNSDDGAASLSSSWVDIGVGGGSSSFTQSGDTTHQVAGNLRVGKAGSYTLNSGTLSAGNLEIGDLGVVNLQGGTLKLGTGTISGTLNWASGTLNFTGDYATGDFLGHDMVLSAGQILKGDAQIRVGSGDSLTFAGGALQANDFQMDVNASATVGRGSSLAANTVNNYGRLMLDGGSVNGALLNAGTMTGSGTIRDNLGWTGFTNSGRFDQGDYVELAYSVSNLNTGVWTLGKGSALQLRESNLNNQGFMSLAGASIAAFDDTSVLSNEATGTISGNGVISANFANQGSLIVDGGRLAIEKSFVNGGQILLTSAIARLSGGAIDNTGRIEGLGQIGNAINNQGFVSAKSGTLTLAAAVSNSGTLTVGRDATLLLTQGLQPNTGKIQLAGGTFDNNGKALVNQATGVISGFGEVRSGVLSNNGLVLLSGGVSAVYSEVVANAGSQIILSGYSNTTFYDKVEVKDGAELRVSEGSVATFAAEVKQRSGSDVNGDGKMFFEGGLAIGNSPGYGYIQGTVTFSSSNTYTAEIGGINACTTLSCATGAALANDSFDKLEVGGNFTMGGKLVLTSWNGFVAQAGQSFDLLDWGTLNGTGSGTFKSIDASGFMLAAGTKLDYSQLYSNGTVSVTAVPEPETYAMMLAGLGLVGWSARRRASRG
jgi:hypothetical protein